MDLPRNEYPRPQFERTAWINLNGEWTCAMDFGLSGKERGWKDSTGFEQKIIVPFCPESALSGIKYTDFIPAIWYQRKITVPSALKGKKVLFHCAGIDYQCELYLDGQYIGSHTGTASPVTFELNGFIKFGKEQNLVIYVKDDTRSGIQPRGKQARLFKSAYCDYTRTTGIWQTVWLEAVHPYGLQSCRIVPDYDEKAFSFTPKFWNVHAGNTFHVKIKENKHCVCDTFVFAADGTTAKFYVPNAKEWNPDTPFLYEIEFTVKDEFGKTIDRVFSYAGLRKIHVEGNQIFLNNRPIFLRLVLDQGFYPEGIWTAPTDDALKKDIELSMAAGFNGARLHQKVFEERFHYWADRLGYLTWAEFPDWGVGLWHHFTNDPTVYYHSLRDYLSQWQNVLLRQVNHPSIIAWTPFNETSEAADWEEHYRMVADVYDLTKALDPTRPVNDTSGYVHSKTDLWTVHNYEKNATQLKKQMNTEPVWCTKPEVDRGYHGQPYLVDEYGGVGFLAEGRKPFADNTWGYGDGNKLPSDPVETLKRIKALTDVLVDHPKIQGYCYTQLTDIEQEQNGLYYYERVPKFEMKKVCKIFGRKPKWSKW